MKHQMQARFAAPPDVVVRMFGDKAFHVKKLDALGLPYKVLAQEADANTFRIRVERKVPVQMPGGKKAEATVVNEELWHLAERRGSVKVDAGMMPIDCACTAQIVADGKHTRVVYDWTIKSSVPLLGGQIEKMALADMETRFADETRVAASLLNDYL
ncbi:DUF2505 domain-containing protein [Solimonas soli]|uniref:DUF2505 domain-containing protein n=1 Tax=Solimonas soli TaxID=413479 RepID=UPI0004861804|nr:DUF2505 domain-containing protein [Solimonas soli]